MRLHRISLSDVRGVDGAEVSFDPTGVTVVEGPNESGKSTLLDTFELLLGTAHTSRGKPVRDLVPVGRDVTPVAEATFTTGPYRLTLRKGWLRRPFAELRVDHPDGRVEQLVGTAAEHRVQELLADHVDQHLRRALSFLQGSSREALAPGDWTSVARALDRAAHAIADPPGVAPEEQGNSSTDGPEETASVGLYQAVADHYLTYWTPGGAPRKDRLELAGALELAVERSTTLTKRMAEVDRMSPQLEVVRAELAELTATLGQTESSLVDLRSELESARRIESAVIAARSQLEVSEVRLAEATRAMELRSAMVDRAERAARVLTGSEESIGDSAPDLEAADRRLREAQEGVDAAAAEFAAAEAAAGLAQSDLGHLEREVNLTLVEERLQRVLDAVERRRTANALLAAEPVTEERLAALESAAGRSAEADIRAEAAAPTVTTTVLGSERVTVDGSEVAATDVRAVASSAVVEVPGVVRVEVVPGGDAEALALERDRAARQLEELCRAAGVAGIAAARESAASRLAAERSITEANETIRRDARDLSVEELRDLVDRLRDESASFLAGRPTSPDLPPDIPAARTTYDVTASRLRVSRAQMESASSRLDLARQARQQVALDQARFEERIVFERAQSDEAQAALAAARAEVGDGDLRGAVEAATAGRSVALERFETDERRLRTASPDVVAERLRNSEAVVVSIRDRIGALQQDVVALEVRLDEAGREGLATQAAEAATEVGHLESGVSRTEARAAAAELLFRTLEHHRVLGRQRYRQPLRDRIEHFGRIVFGSSFGVDLDDHLRVVSRRLDGDELRLDQLSEGAREQIALIVRLALATLVEDDDGAPVVVDDALGWSDWERLGAMSVVLQAAGRQTQVIVLTCTPGRFARIGGARFVTLEGVRSPSTSS